MEKHKAPELQKRDGLFVYERLGEVHTLGYLMYFEGHGVFDAEHGRVEVSKVDAEIHNNLLDEALIKGLDETCNVGQGSMFYVHETGLRTGVRTFMGTVVAEHVKRNGRVITFDRKGRTFRGWLRKRTDLVFVKRIA